ncbi:MAG: trigger factor [Crocinitomicaceae bacterium]|jgi:trigger factor|nr:trigger factor [Crocinitomicaceae bacterium]MDG1734565.1 trigger factor [Crocinitomicaceae bacterium]MDG2505919.1 trigger factor [Crocinitomicaceae bacterium]
MKVLQESVDKLNAVLKVEIKSEDYQNIVKASLEKYRKSAKVPGFRPGKVPFGMIQKQYGKSVLAEELNKLANDSLYKFITEEKLEILGNPIPTADETFKGDMENPGDFEFAYEIGFSPKFDIPLSSRKSIEYFAVKVDNKLISDQIEDLRRRYGKMESTPEVGEKDMVMGLFRELDASGAPKENGVENNSTISMEFIKDKKATKSLMGIKVDAAIELDPRTVSKDEKDLASMLGIEEAAIAGISKKFKFTVNDIKRMELAELNEELYDKLFPNQNVKTESDMKAKVTTDLENMFKTDSDRLFTQSVYDFLMDKTKMTLPESFLKRWIKLSNEKPIDDETLNKEFDGYLKSMKWQLIQGRIFKENDIQISNEEVMDFTKSLLVSNYAQYGMPAPDDKELSETAMRLLKDKEQVNGIYDRITEKKLSDYFQANVPMKEKKLSYDDFVKKASKK